MAPPSAPEDGARLQWGLAASSGGRVQWCTVVLAWLHLPGFALVCYLTQLDANQAGKGAAGTGSAHLVALRQLTTAAERSRRWLPPRDALDAVHRPACPLNMLLRPSACAQRVLPGLRALAAAASSPRPFTASAPAWGYNDEHSLITEQEQVSSKGAPDWASLPPPPAQLLPLPPARLGWRAHPARESIVSLSYRCTPWLA